MHKARTLCNPVDKNGEGIRQREAHLVCYDLKNKVSDDEDSDSRDDDRDSGDDDSGGGRKLTVFTRDQFGLMKLRVHDNDRSLCVPSSKRLL